MRSGGGSASPSTPARERPVVRPDEGRVEFDRYVEIYKQCLRDQGIDVGTGAKPHFEVNDGNRAAVEKCEILYPETWMDRERRTNAEFIDMLRKVAQCLVSKGHDVTVGGDPVAIMYRNNTSANEADADLQVCERQVFKDSIEKYNKR